MIRNPIPLMAALLLLSVATMAQRSSLNPYELQLRSRPFLPASNITVAEVEQFDQSLTRINGEAYAVLQFEELPTEAIKLQLQQAGILLGEYIPNKTFTVTIKGTVNTILLQQVKARALFTLLPQQKMHPALANNILPSWAVKTPGYVDLWISFPQSVPYSTVKQYIADKGFEITNESLLAYQTLGVRVAVPQITELAAIPFITYVEPAPHPDQPLNFISRSVSKVNVLNAPLAQGGRNLRGEGVVVGVGDNADVQYHVDFTNRLVNRAAELNRGHGSHVTGTIGGAGNRIELYTGYAPKSTIVSQVFSNIFTHAASYVNDYGMVITNNSYGSIVSDCEYAGVYDLESRILDLQALSLPSLQNVFAAGNSGLTPACGNFPAGFQTVLGGYQAAKNTLCVGAADNSGAIAGFSSKGPVKDGRVKPDISAMGVFVASTWLGNIYSYNNGTSMAAPAASGGLALLYQRYRQLNSGANPKNALMKALLCNGANDKGNAGPDYSNGFGWMNLLRSVDMLENTRYYTQTISQAQLQSNTITVPANTAELKVMLYWNDPAALPLAVNTLVNDLDLNVVTPSSATILPKVLDPAPANVNNPATEAPDHKNNMEQVSVLNPAAGIYTVNVNGFAIPQGPQEYHLVYDIIPVSTTLSFPAGGEALEPGETVLIQWDAYGAPANTFNLEYTTDGTTWNVIDAAVAANLRQYSWVIPNVTTDLARVRITRNGTGMISTGNPFTIIGKPVIALSAVQCEDYISIDWPAVPNASDYEVMWLRGDEMVSRAIVPNATLNYVFSGLSADSLYWVTVRARINGKPGRRADALSRQPNNGTCAGSISDGDVKVVAILTPAQSGRDLTSTAMPNSYNIVIRLKNLDDVMTTVPMDIQYSFNGGPTVVETLSPWIAAGGTMDHTFFTPAGSALPGPQTISVFIDKAFDNVSSNDTITKTFFKLANPALNLATTFTDDLEAANDSAYLSRQVGIQGLDRYDFINSTAFGRLRTFVNTGIAYSGRNALTLDIDRFNGAGNVDSLTGTFNLSSYTAAASDIRLDFRYKNHGQNLNPANKVWIRGTDVLPWLEVYDLAAEQNDADGSFKLSRSIELSDALLAGGQDFSTSFQVRWGQFGQFITSDNNGGAGYTFDDIRLYIAVNDMQLATIDTPITASCALNNATPVRITARNSANTILNNIPVRYRINGGAVVAETIPAVAANASVSYTFTQTADLSATGTYTIETWVEYPGDNVSSNDSQQVVITNSAVVSSFPYLENFESGNGGWYSGGKNITWTYGTPASTKIRSAASGSNAWKTTLAGNYKDKELSYLYSPCFNISGLSNPTLSFSVSLDLEDCGTSLCDGAWVEYSADGISWTKLGAQGQGTNWYNKSYQVWSVENYTRWHVASQALPTGLNNLRLRFVLSADPYVNREGMAVDDIHIYDNPNGIYDGVTMGSPVTQTISGGASWIDFTSGGKLIASVQPNNQNLGSTAVQAYMNVSPPVRYKNGQYYHDRNITIKPATTSLTDSVTVRFYFLDRETDSLIFATGCGTCSKPSQYTQLGVSKYSDTDDNFENGTIADDNAGTWLFILPSQVRKVPFDKGYYAEFKVKDFSEFWLNNGGLSGDQSLPVQLLSFDAEKRNGKDVLARWKVAAEYNVNRYEIEMAKGNTAVQQNQFIKMGETASRGNSFTPQEYSFTDTDPQKTGVRYYRLKIIDQDGSIRYSALRPVFFSDDFSWQVYPNPSKGLFMLLMQQESNEKINVAVYDVNGKRVKQQEIMANGYVQKINVDLQAVQYPAGMYMIEVNAGGRKEVFKVVKQE